MFKHDSIFIFILFDIQQRNRGSLFESIEYRFKNFRYSPSWSSCISTWKWHSFFFIDMSYCHSHSETIFDIEPKKNNQNATGIKMWMRPKRCNYFSLLALIASVALIQIENLVNRCLAFSASLFLMIRIMCWHPWQWWVFWVHFVSLLALWKCFEGQREKNIQYSLKCIFDHNSTNASFCHDTFFSRCSIVNAHIVSLATN